MLGGYGMGGTMTKLSAYANHGELLILNLFNL